MKIGDKVRIHTGKRGKPPHGEVVELCYSERYQDGIPESPPQVRVSRKGYGIEVYPISDLTVIEDEGYPA